ncbi:hypothetical protein I317_02717 [Kwoniella heveanensis CBS 569]|nr:hypothetical protein I317_02717 [Kwoniella heveanensis CBS 569]
MPDEETQPTYDKVYNDPEADLILVSSDNVSFKIFKYHLQSCSYVFREMVSSLDGPTQANVSHSKIEFTDPQLENAATLRLFLDIVTSRQPELKREILAPLRDCILFAKKYECQIVFPSLSMMARQLLKADISRHYIFIIAALVDDVDLAASAIIQAGKWHWPSEDIADPSGWLTNSDTKVPMEPGLLGVNKGAGVMEISSWPLSDINRLPLPYLVALMKVNRKFPLTPESGVQIAAASYFEKLMAEWNKSALAEY